MKALFFLLSKVLLEGALAYYHYLSGSYFSSFCHGCRFLFLSVCLLNEAMRKHSRAKPQKSGIARPEKPL